MDVHLLASLDSETDKYSEVYERNNSSGRYQIGYIFICRKNLVKPTLLR